MANSQVTGGGAILASKENEITTGTTAPTSPSTGWLWVDTSSVPSVVKKWDGSAWNSVGILPTLIDAVGDLLVGSAADSVARLAKGTDNQILRSLASEPNDLGWYTPVDSVTPAALTVGGAGTAGTSLIFARRDHVHAVSGGIAPYSTSGASAGTSLVFANIPGYSAGKVIRIYFTVLSAPSTAVIARFNASATASYTARSPGMTATLLTGQTGVTVSHITGSSFRAEMSFQELGTVSHLMGEVMQFGASTEHQGTFSGFRAMTGITFIAFEWTTSASWELHAYCY